MTDTENGADGTGAAAGAGTLTQEQVNEIVSRRLAQAQKKADEQAAILQAKVDAYEAEKLTETEKLTKAAREAETRATAATEQLKAAETRAFRAEQIAAKAGDLPAVFQGLVVGSSAEEIDASIAAARTQFEALKASLVGQRGSVGSGIIGTAPPMPDGAAAPDNRGMSPYEALMTAGTDRT